MLGCTEIAALTHLKENCGPAAQGRAPDRRRRRQCLLKAGDVLRLQVLHRKGSVAEAPIRRTWKRCCANAWPPFVRCGHGRAARSPAASA